MKSFKNGIHPEDKKELTKDKPIKRAEIPKKVILPLQQNLGCPADPLVKIGDQVALGQKIADSSKLISAPIHASISGKVTQIAKLPNPCGFAVNAIIIESQLAVTSNQLPVKEQTENLSAEEIRKIVREAGIVGMGGAAFPTHVKLSPPAGKKVDTVIINGCECEPFITADYRLMLERPVDLIAGAKLIAKAVGAARIVLAVEKNKKNVLMLFSKKIETACLKTKYPQGGEKMLIKALLNREVPSRGLPSDVGVLVHNVNTAIAVAEAVQLKKPLIERVVTVTGPGVKNPQNLMVRIGTSFAEVIDQCGGLTGDVVKVIMGGPMTGLTVSSLDLPIVKATNCILALTRKEAKVYEEQDCIRCGRCVKSCPVFLLPNFLAEFTKMKNWEKLEEYNVADCIECGACAYVCPSRIPLVQYLKVAKNELITRRAVCR